MKFVEETRNLKLNMLHNGPPYIINSTHMHRNWIPESTNTHPMFYVNSCLC